MNKTIIASTLLGLLSGGVLLSAGSSVALAADKLSLSAEVIETTSSVDLSVNSKKEAFVAFDRWLPDLINKFNQLPEVRAQLVRQQQAELAIQAADRAIYNPELGMNYLNAQTGTYTVGVSQTIDWGDKRGATTSLAQLNAQILLAEIGLERSQMFGERLLALAEQAQSRKALTFAEQQLRFTKAQLLIAKQRLATGDLSDVELQLMQLELASNTADHALAEQAALVADAKVIELLGDESFVFHEFIDNIPSALPSSASEQAEVWLPALALAYQQVLLARVNAVQVKANTTADPTINIAAEKEGTDNKFGMGISIPLQLRNNYSELQALAEKDIAIAEQQYLARERVLNAKDNQFKRALPRLLARYQDWRELVQASGAKAAKSLSQQWQAGDVSTSEYLQSRRQLAASYLVGLNLETAIYQSWLTWMGESGQLMSFIEQHLASAQTPSRASSASSMLPSHTINE
ncbi:MAG: TolC family protein [Shewanella sp.]